MGNNKIKIGLTIVQALLWLIIGAAIGMVLASDMEGSIKALVILIILLVVIAFMIFTIYLVSKELDAHNKGHSTVTTQRSMSINNHAQVSSAKRTEAKVSSVPEQNAEAQINRNNGPVQPREQKLQTAKQHIKKVVLINEEGQALREWNVAGKSGILIGKSVNKDIVDIDLSESAYAQMISKQHAVLNYTGDKWCVEDNDSKNGTRVKKLNQNAILDLKLTGSVEVEPGDIIYIANTMIQLG